MEGHERFGPPRRFSASALRTRCESSHPLARSAPPGARGLPRRACASGRHARARPELRPSCSASSLFFAPSLVAAVLHLAIGKDSATNRPSIGDGWTSRSREVAAQTLRMLGPRQPIPERSRSSIRRRTAVSSYGDNSVTPAQRMRPPGFPRPALARRESGRPQWAGGADALALVDPTLELRSLRDRARPRNPPVQLRARRSASRRGCELADVAEAPVPPEPTPPLSGGDRFPAGAARSACTACRSECVRGRCRLRARGGQPTCRRESRRPSRRGSPTAEELGAAEDKPGPRGLASFRSPSPASVVGS